MSAARQPTLLDSCARAATADEARFRIDGAITNPLACVVALDDGAAAIVAELERGSWNEARFVTVDARLSEISGSERAGTVPPPDGSNPDIAAVLAGTDLVVLLATQEESGALGHRFARACRERGVSTAGIVVSAESRPDRALAALRPHTQVLVTLKDARSVAEVLTALRA